MAEYKVIEKIMNSKLNEEDKLHFIKSFLLHWITENEMQWIWE